MGVVSLGTITDDEIKKKGVQALADRPNLSAQYGASGLSSAQLKAWFDNLANLLAKKINAITEALEGESAPQYIRVNLDGLNPPITNLQELISAIGSGQLAEKYIKVTVGEKTDTLANWLFNISNEIADIKENMYVEVVRLV